jgi:predicted TPR repeat methyltransferase
VRQAVENAWQPPRRDLVSVTRQGQAAVARSVAAILAVLPDGCCTMPTISQALAIAVQHHQAGRLQAAEQIYRQILAVEPSHVDAIHLLGVLAHQTGDDEKAVRYIQRAIALDDGEAPFHNNLGAAYAALGRFAEAAACGRRAVALKPDYAEAHYNLGNVLKVLGRQAEAVASYLRAIEWNPGYAQAHNNLGTLLNDQGKLDEAVACYRRAVALKPDYAQAYHNLGLVLQQQGKQAEANAVWQQWAAADPENPIARHMRAAGTGRDIPPRCSDGYVRDAFDGFAQGFDKKLHAVDYRGPELVGAAVARALGDPRGDLDVLDGGCGTGLCAPLLRPYARRLGGVDLSRGMLAKAEARQTYDELIVGELTAHLQALARRYDLIVLADTLIYFGDLRPVFLAAAGALRPRGLLIFTVEKAIAGEDGGAGYALRYHGRYCHTEAYLCRLTSEAGLTLCELESATLRTELGRPVEGLVASACKE